MTAVALRMLNELLLHQHIDVGVSHVQLPFEAGFEIHQ